jgi:predicted nucleic acid-binding protein
MIAAVCAWHERHEPAAAEIERRLGRGEELVVAGPALVEAYAVLTRLPPPHRLSPRDALALLEGNFLGSTRIVALGAASYRSLVRKAPAVGVSGGRSYDLVIATCAHAAKASALLTLNEEHFRSHVGRGLRIVVPA